MSTLKKYTELKSKVEEAQQKANKAAGALEQVMKTLKEQFGCSTLEAAEKKLKLLQKQHQNINTQYEKEIEDFEEKWDEL